MALTDCESDDREPSKAAEPSSRLLPLIEKLDDDEHRCFRRLSITFLVISPGLFHLETIHMLDVLNV
jgi:hypothetical protein